MLRKILATKLDLYLRATYEVMNMGLHTLYVVEIVLWVGMCTGKCQRKCTHFEIESCAFITLA